ncbi:hypothetical protein D3C83_13520 [compost metagenome]
MRQAHVLGHVVVRAHAQARHRVEIAVARGEKNDGQRSRQGAQLPAEREAAVHFVAEPDVEQGQVRQAQPHGGERLAAVVVGGDFVAVLPEYVGVVGADDRVVFNDGDASAHAVSRGATRLYRTGTRSQGRPGNCHIPATFDRGAARFRLRPPIFQVSNTGVATLRRRKGSGCNISGKRRRSTPAR